MGCSGDAAKLTSPRASPAKSRPHRKEEEKEEEEEEEEEASNRVSPLPMTWRCRIRPATRGRWTLRSGPSRLVGIS